jgi:hypothetical protein
VDARARLRCGRLRRRSHARQALPDLGVGQQQVRLVLQERHHVAAPRRLALLLRPQRRRLTQLRC